LGYRFNVGGPVTDGVTPLPWAFLLAPFARAPALDVLVRAKYMGLAAWIAAAAVFGVAVGRAPSRAGACSLVAKGAALVVLALSLPVAAHVVSGMETGITIACATMAALSASRHPRMCAALAGFAAALRPEMAPWAASLAFGVAWAGRSTVSRAIVNAVIAIAPFAACTLVRVAVFGRPAPLAVLAKPSDLSHGAVYAVAALLVTATPILVLSPLALLRGPRAARAVVGAAAVHIASIAAVGGDWMPYARLLSPIAPSLAWAYVLLLPCAHRFATALRASAALTVGAANFVHASPAGRTVSDDRRALVARARPYLTDAATVAALDIGWVSAATEGTIVDLAGVTDLDVAALPGGHTSKRIDAPLVLSKHPDALLFRVGGGILGGGAGDLSAWQDARYNYLVEARLAHSDLIATHFAPRAFLPLGQTGGGYVLLVRREP